jgi:DNA polymerase-3 subunit epsilon
VIDEHWLNNERQQAAVWARNLLARGFVIFDSETTGLDERDEFVQLGVIDHTGNILLDTLVKPTQPIAPRAVSIHGLSPIHLIRAPHFRDVHAALAQVLTGQHVVVYNAEFDKRILRQACDRYKLPLIEPKSWECAMERYAQYYGAWDGLRGSFRWKSLIGACAIEQVEVLNAHAAIDDCRLTLRLIEKMAASLG